MRARSPVVGSVLSLVLLGARPGWSRDVSVTPEARASADNAFGFALARGLADPTSNFVFSPHSVAVALGMTRVGAAGATAAQMDEVLRLGSPSTDEARAALAKALVPVPVRERGEGGARETAPYELRIANALWVQEGFPLEETFTSALSSRFGAAPRRIDFREAGPARAAINGWVEEQTAKRIKDLLSAPQPLPDTRLAIVNAVWFKAAWDVAFERESTQDASFTTAAGADVKVPTMAQTHRFDYAETDDVQVLELSHRHRQTSVVFVLPRKKDGLAAVEGGLDLVKFGGWTGALRSRKVAVRLPRFRFTWGAELNAALTTLGMRDAFSRERADFSGMTKGEPLYVGLVAHKAFVAVDEDGTEAAAATAVLAAPTSMPAPEEPVAFTADHPFLFFVRHRATGAILFAGRVADPSKS